MTHDTLPPTAVYGDTTPPPPLAPLPLQGLRILDLSRLLPGPFATLVLADLGATVDKIEEPGGDYLRHVAPLGHGASPLFSTLNRNKRSLELDLKSDAGKAALLRLAPHYDVLIDPFRPGVLARLGLGYERLQAEHPGLIICAITGYGQTGPLRARAGHDVNYLARAGVLATQGPSAGPPQLPSTQVADIGGALFACIAILAALRERDRTGVGTQLDISLAESAMPFALATMAALYTDTAGSPAPPAEADRGAALLTGGLAPYGIYETHDGRFVALAALEPKFWSNFAAVIGIPADMSAMMLGPHQVELRATLTHAFKARPFAEWVALAEAHDFCLDPVLDATEVQASPWAHARGRFISVLHPEGSEAQLALPTTPARVHTAAPKVGGDSAAILREAGFAETEIAALVR